MSDPDRAFAPSAEEPAEDTESLLLGVIRDVRDLLAHVLQRLDALAAAPAPPPVAPGPSAANVQALDAKVGELGAAMGSIATMLENIDMAIHAATRESDAPGFVAPPPNAALVERVAAAGGSVGINALLHARIESIEQHVEGSSAEVRRIKAQLDHIEEGIGYLAAALLGGSVD